MKVWVVTQCVDGGWSSQFIGVALTRDAAKRVAQNQVNSFHRDDRIKWDDDPYLDGKNNVSHGDDDYFRIREVEVQ